MTPVSSYAQKLWADVHQGQVLPPIELHVDYARIILNAASTWDYFPGHHNPSYARAQGQPDIYASTIFFHGFVDRLVTDWGGPETFIRRRRLRMIASVHPGDTMRAEGRVVRHYRSDENAGLVDIDIQVSTARGLCVPASITARLPLTAGEALFQFDSNPLDTESP